MTEAFEDTLAAVRERVDPDEAERRSLAAAAERLAERAREAVSDLPVEADVIQVGSTARGTWVSGDRDIDLFVRFPTDLDRPDLERYGLEIGHAVLPDGHEEYAEHPYVKGTFEGYEVDLVPCYDVASAGDIRSAVDRTPFHTEYLEARIDDALAGEVRLAKGFLKGIGAYGSDLRTRGFSGYLTELLVVEYGGFRELLDAATDWHPPVVLDPEDHAEATFDDSLVVVDPTDPERNVAAVVSEENVARLQHYARELLAEPRIELFEPREPEPIGSEDVRVHLARRGTAALALRFDPPDLVADQLYPQLRRSERGLVRGLEKAGFGPLRSDAWASEGADGFEEAVLFVELAHAELPAVERHGGPPVSAGEHARGFYAAYADGDAYGPFLDGERYAVERERELRTPAAFVREKLFDVALGAHVETALEEEYELLTDEQVAVLADAFGEELRRYFEPRP